jgi:hypothetical protein
MSKYVYVISNPAFEGWVKVGRANDIKHRVSVMQSGVPHIHRYSVEMVVEFADDTPVHWELEERKIERSGEWFRCSKHEAIEAVKKVMAEYDQFDVMVEENKKKAIEDGWI